MGIPRQWSKFNAAIMKLSLKEIKKLIKEETNEVYKERLIKRYGVLKAKEEKKNVSKS